MSVVAHVGFDHAAIGVAAAVVDRGVRAGVVARTRSTARLCCWVGGVGLVVLASTPLMERLAARDVRRAHGAAPRRDHRRGAAARARPAGAHAAARRVDPDDADRAGDRCACGTATRRSPGRRCSSPCCSPPTSRRSTTAPSANRCCTSSSTPPTCSPRARCGRRCSASGAAPPSPASAAVFGVIAGSAFLGVILLAATEPLMPTYAARLGAERALDDQRDRGGDHVGHRHVHDAAAARRRRVALGLGRGAQSAPGRGPRRRYGDPAEAARRSTVASAPPVTVTAVTSSPWPSSTNHVPARELVEERRRDVTTALVALPHARVDRRAGLARRPQVQLDALGVGVEEHDECTDVAADVEHAARAAPCEQRAVVSGRQPAWRGTP